MFSLHPIFSAAIVGLSIVFLVVGPYAATRFFLRNQASDDTASLASSITFRTASLHGLILALVFAQEQVNVIDLRKTTAREAASAADIFYDFGRYGENGMRENQKSLAEYVDVVVSEEWDGLAKGHLSARAWQLWDDVFTGILDLDPKTPRQVALRARMLEDIDTISECRNIRRADYSSGVTALFWTVAILGIVFVVLPYFVFPASKINLLLLCSFAAFNGVVMYTILAMANPYSRPGSVRPTPFIEIFAHDMDVLLAEEAGS